MLHRNLSECFQIHRLLSHQKAKSVGLAIRNVFKMVTPSIGYSMVTEGKLLIFPKTMFKTES